MNFYKRNYRAAMLDESTAINKAFLVKTAKGNEQKFKLEKANVTHTLELEGFKDTLNQKTFDKLVNACTFIVLASGNKLSSSIVKKLSSCVDGGVLESYFLDKLNSDCDLDTVLGELEVAFKQSVVYPELSDYDRAIWNRVKVIKDFGGDKGMKWVMAVDDSGRPVGYMPEDITQKTMHHCGNEPTVSDGNVYYELRDKRGKAYLTVILNDRDEIEESKSFGNKPSAVKDVVAEPFKWFIMSSYVSGVGPRYTNGYAPSSNYGVKDLFDDKEFIDKVIKTKPSLIGGMERCIFFWKDVLERKIISESEFLTLANSSITMQVLRDAYDNTYLINGEQDTSKIDNNYGCYGKKVQDVLKKLMKHKYELKRSYIYWVYEEPPSGAHEGECEHCDGEGTRNCSECNGRGSYNCDDCDGDGEVECDNCGGKGVVECPTCDGTGEDEEGEPCLDCDGDGEVECEDCDGSGKEECPYCDGLGRLRCEECGGSGEEECPYCEGSGRSEEGNDVDYDWSDEFNSASFLTDNFLDVISTVLGKTFDSSAKDVFVANRIASIKKSDNKFWQAANFAKSIASADNKLIGNPNVQLELLSCTDNIKHNGNVLETILSSMIAAKNVYLGKNCIKHHVNDVSDSLHLERAISMMRDLTSDNGIYAPDDDIKVLYKKFDEMIKSYGDSILPNIEYEDRSIGAQKQKMRFYKIGGMWISDTNYITPDDNSGRPISKLGLTCDENGVYKVVDKEVLGEINDKMRNIGYSYEGSIFEKLLPYSMQMLTTKFGLQLYNLTNMARFSMKYVKEFDNAKNPFNKFYASAFKLNLELGQRYVVLGDNGKSLYQIASSRNYVGWDYNNLYTDTLTEGFVIRLAYKAT